MLVVGILVSAIQAAELPSKPLPKCDDTVTVCPVPPGVRREAKSAYERGLKLEKQNLLDEALAEFEKAAQLVPRDVHYLRAREMVRQQLVFEALQRGNQAMAAGNDAVAAVEFRTALHLDPENPFAQQRMQDVLAEKAPPVAAKPQVVETSGEIRLAPLETRRSFHYRGDSRALLAQVASTYGITVIFDDSAVSRRVRFDVENVDFFTAMLLAGRVTKTFYSPLGATQVLVAAESAENHRLFERFGLRTFYIPGASTQQQLTDMVNILRTMFEIRFIQSQPQAGTITVRAPQTTLDTVTRFLEGLDSSSPEILLDMQVYQISNQLTRNFGLHIPTQLTIYNIPAAALAGLAALGGQNIQNLINQLIAGGGINQANSQAISALIAQLQGQQNSIFSTPLATFGNGDTLFGITFPPVSATLQLNESSVRTLEKVTIHASQGKDATFNLGERYPIINASFAPIYNSAAIAQTIQGGSYIAPLPSVSYEDLGIKVKVKPNVHGSSAVSLNLDIQLTSLTGMSNNGVPVISNRSYTGGINLKDGEPAAVAGEISHTDTRSLSGIPGFGNVPGLSHVMTSNSMENDEDELLIVITPHIISEPQMNPNNEIWLSSNQ
jgi:general secretion pathway protein D